MPPSPSDRNVLFGVLALQMEFITQAGLIAALQAWTLQKSRLLGELLVELGHMSAEDRAALEPMVDRHVARHGGSAEQSLAALSSVSDVATELRHVADAELQKTLQYFGARSPQRQDRAASTGELPDQPQQQRFELLRAHAEGGLGKVWIAKDRELNREVAFKEIKPSHAEDSGSRGRFVLEAEITGGLEHPGIVPIYSLGHHDNGRPFYAMRFIRGDSLKEAVQQFHSPATKVAHPSDPNAATIIGTHPLTANGGRQPSGVAVPGSTDQQADACRSPDFGSIEFRQLLGRFVDVCNAIEYAHSRGVLHRDLKPGNIMLGKYGETLVVDWGLAKATGKADQFADADEATLMPSSGSGVEPTQIGSAIGTPAYMSPEQAAGRLDELGPATDVYSLGATLYHVLTGQPPLSTNQPDNQHDAPASGSPRDHSLARRAKKLTIPELLERVQRGDFPTPHAINAQIPKPLEAICLKAMSLRPSDRYSSTAALAADVERYLADEPVSAHAEPFTIRARRWVKRHQVAVTSLAAAVVVALIGLGVLSAVVSGSNLRLKSANDTITAKNEQLRQTNEQLTTARTDAEQQRDTAIEQKTRANEQAAIATAVNDFLRKDLLGQADIGNQSISHGERNPDITARELLERAATSIEGKFNDQPLVEAAIRATIGATYLNLGLFDSAEPHHQRALALRQESLGDDHLDTIQSFHNLAVLYQARGRYVEAETLQKQVLEARRQKLGEEDTSTLMAAYNLVEIYRTLGRYKDAEPLAESVLEKRRKALGSDNSDTIYSMNSLAAIYRFQGRLENAEQLFKEAMDASREKLGEDHPLALISGSNLAELYGSIGRNNEAEQLFKHVLAISQQKLRDDHPSTLTRMNNLAEFYRVQRRFDEAEPLAKKVVEMWRQRLGTNHSHTLTAMNNLAAIYYSQRRYAASEELFREALDAIRQTLGNDHPDTLRGMNNLAVLLIARGRPDEAEPLYKQVLETSRLKLGDDHPNTLSTMSNLAVLYRSQGRIDQAIPLFEAAVKGAKLRFGMAHPQTQNFIQNLLASYEASQSFEAAESIFRELAVFQSNKSGANSKQYAGALIDLGVNLVANRKIAEGTETLSAAGEILRQVENGGLESAAYASLLVQWGQALLDTQQFEPAEEKLRECLTLRQKLAPDDWPTFNAQSLLGASLAGQKKFADAEPLLLSAYAGLKTAESAKKIPAAAKSRPTEALQRLIDLYTAWEKPDQAAEWKKKLEEVNAAMKEAATKLSEEPAKPDSQMSKLATGDWDALLKVDAKVLPQLLILRAIEMLKRGELAHAVQAADKLCELEPKDKHNLYNAACLYARCAERVTKDKPAPTDVEQAERQKFLKLAIDTLKQSFAAGWDDFAHMKKDDDLKPLRGLPEFEALFPKKP